jgi:ABC-type dipeptide/oligopeptide/nickel transport system permease component
MRDHYRRLYGLDQPLPVQYLSWLGRLFQGDFGVSYTYRNESVQDVLARAWPVSVRLGLTALLLAVGLGVPLGVASATHRGRSLDYLSRGLALFGAATPVYVLATLAVLLFTVYWRIVPLTGAVGPARILLPAVVLALGPLAVLLRYTRTATLETLGADFVRTAHAKGLRSHQVIGGHVLKNALLPVLTLAGPLAATLLGGSFFVETIFNLPGLGATFVFAAANRDYPLIMAGALLSGCLIIGLNLAVDLSYGLLDPRIRLEPS